jgi:hypothetical protein
MNTIKKTNTFIASAILISALLIMGCKKDFEEINTDPNSPSGILRVDFLLSGAEKGLMDFTWDAFWGAQTGMQLAQYWSSNQYASESRYQFRTAVTSGYWTRLYAGGNNDMDDNLGGLIELQTIINACEKDPSVYAVFGDPDNQIAAATILKTWAFQMITDTWGDVPYSEALKASENASPKYDSQRDIYLGMLAELNSAIARINLSTDGPTGDLIYNGDMSAWKKFGNSLKMRIAIRMADREPTIAGTAISEASASGAFESNSDNALFQYLPTDPNWNLYYFNRYIDARQDYAGSNILVDQLLALNDARIYSYLEPNVDQVAFYRGEVYGLYDADAASTPNDSISQPGRKVLSADAPGVYMSYAEVEFILAEAVERGFISGSAESHYDDGITASFDYWQPELNQDFPLPTVDNYLLQTSVDYSDQIASGQTWKQVIGKQKWIALYMQGFEGWSEWRRLDFGILQLPAGGVLDGTGIPLRMYYSVDEQTLNAGNYSAAVAAMGGDAMDVRVWWDMN